MLRENRLTSLCYSVRHPGGRVTSFCLPTAPQERREQRSWPEGRRAGCPESKEVTQKKGTRVGRRRFAPVRYGRPGFCRQAIHGLRQKRRDPSRRPARCAGLIRPPFAAPHGLNVKGEAKAKPRAKALGPGFTRATRSPFGPASLFARCARSRRDDDLGEFFGFEV